ncbi:MAG: type II toxin-antitoxin system HicB family antitoxin [Solirubrobacterales bacterium]|nr:type II toxin-antitoxin system HicB family antitoxin [Solirubrobacterales bacterium]
MELHLKLHAEDGAFWAEVQELPGCFAAGDTLEELTESLNEALALYLEEEPVNPDRISPSALDFSRSETLTLNA